MLTPLLLILIGVILGFLAGSGIGGGSLLIIWLTLILHTEQSVARGINLMFFLAAAGSVSLFRWRNGTLDLHTIVPAILGGCVAATLCSWLGTQINPEILRKIFGILVLFTGCKELLYRPRKAK